jgi:hypothetical protein
MAIADLEGTLEEVEALPQAPADDRVPCVRLSRARPQDFVAQLLARLHPARRRLHPLRDAQGVGERGGDTGLQVPDRPARCAVDEHRARGVEVLERAVDIEVLGVDRVDERQRHAEPRVRLGGAPHVAELLVDRKRLLQEGDVAAHVAHHHHELGERNE